VLAREEPVPGIVIFFPVRRGQIGILNLSYYEILDLMNTCGRVGEESNRKSSKTFASDLRLITDKIL